MSKNRVETLYTYGDFAIFGGLSPILKVVKILSVQDQVEASSPEILIDLLKEFRYSFNGSVWSEWFLLDKTYLDKIPLHREIEQSHESLNFFFTEDQIFTVDYLGYKKTYSVSDSVPIRMSLDTSNGIIELNYGFILDFDTIALIEANYQNENSKIFLREVDSKPIYFQIRYTNLHQGEGTYSISNVSPIVEAIVGEKHVRATVPPQPCGDSGCLSPILLQNKSTFDIMAQNPLSCVFQELSYSINMMAGVPTQYFKYTPIQKSNDVILHEWTLYNVEDCKNIKIIIPENEFPDAKMSWNTFGGDFEMPFEIQISKKYFEEVFGQGAPQKRDIIYIPVQNRIFEVQSSTLHKDFLNIGIYYKLALAKWQPRSNAMMTQEAFDDADLKTTSIEELFGDLVDIQEEKIAPKRIQKEKIKIQDKIREDMNSQIVSEKILNYMCTVAETYYDLNADVNDKYWNPVVWSNKIALNYAVSIYNPKDEDRAFSCWFRSPELKQKGVSVVSITQLQDSSLDILLVSNKNFNIGQEIQLYTTAAVIPATIYNVNGQLVQAKIKPELLSIIETNYPGWINFDFKLRHYTSNVLINGHSNNKGIRVALHRGLVGIKYAEVNLNEKTYFMQFNAELPVNKWYGLFLNISNEFETMTLNLWKIKWDINTNEPKTSQLQLEQSFQQDIFAEDRTSITTYNIPTSTIHLTNIRVWNSVCEKTLQPAVLNQHQVKDSHLLLLLDNADEQSRRPYFGR